jgi:hypothetical protein
VNEWTGTSSINVNDACVVIMMSSYGALGWLIGVSLLGVSYGSHRRGERAL